METEFINYMEENANKELYSIISDGYIENKADFINTYSNINLRDLDIKSQKYNEDRENFYISLNEDDLADDIETIRMRSKYIRELVDKMSKTDSFEELFKYANSLEFNYKEIINKENRIHNIVSICGLPKYKQ